MIDLLAKKLNINHVQLSPQNIPLLARNNIIEDDTVKQSGLIIYTSGTTGRPKGALHTYRSLNFQVMTWHYIAFILFCLSMVILRLQFLLNFPHLNPKIIYIGL